MDADAITLSVDDGTVYLFGNVVSNDVKGQADDLASRVNGVTDVVNGLHVGGAPYSSDPYVDDWTMDGFDWYGDGPSTATKSDLDVWTDVEEELHWSPFVDVDEVTVTVRDGIVTLTGTVDSWTEWSAARDNAIDGGAVRVRNRLEVASIGEPALRN